MRKLAIPDASLGDLSDLAVKLVSVSKKIPPSVSTKCVVIMAADHGVTAESVSKYPLVTSSLVIFMFVEGFILSGTSNKKLFKR